MTPDWLKWYGGTTRPEWVTSAGSLERLATGARKVMAFCLGKLTNLPNKVERYPEIVEPNVRRGGGPPRVSYC